MMGKQIITILMNEVSTSVRAFRLKLDIENYVISELILYIWILKKYTASNVLSFIYREMFLL